MVDLTPLNVAQLIKKNIATEYREAGNLRAYVRALLCDHDVLDSLLRLIADRLNVDTQEGKNLDTIGIIVGRQRGVIAASGVKFFGFAPHPLANSFGRKGNLAIGGRFRKKGESLTGNKELTDTEYRGFIKAQIFKNHARSTPDEVIQFLKLVLGADTPVFVDNATPRPGHATIAFGRQLTLNERYLITEGNLIPTTLGVTYHFDFPFVPPLVINEFTVVV